MLSAQVVCSKPLYCNTIIKSVNKSGAFQPPKLQFISLNYGPYLLLMKEKNDHLPTYSNKNYTGRIYLLQSILKQIQEIVITPTSPSRC